MVGKRRLIFTVFCITLLMFYSLTSMAAQGKKGKGKRGADGKEPPPGPITSVPGPDVPRMANMELTSLIGDPDVVIIDLDKADHWDVPNRKKTTIIKGAVIIGEAYFASMMDDFIKKYPKDKTYVFYCG